MRALVTFGLSASLAIACSSSDSAPTQTDPTADASPAADGSSLGDASTVSDSGGADGARSDAPSADAGGSETLSTSFVYVGCNRISKGDWIAQQNPSSANVPQLKQTFADVAAMPDKPKHFFFAGDLVLGLVADSTVLRAQLDGWAAVFKGDPVSSMVDLVPLVGNHEMLVKTTIGGAKVELSNTGADGVWTQWTATNQFDAHAGNGPTNAAPNADALQDDESRLSYSFDAGDVHYVVLNTDTWTTAADTATGSTQIGWVALQWLTRDLRAAQGDARTKSIFVFGHKPLVAPPGVSGSDSIIAASLVQPMETLLDATPKVKGYLCAHAHQWDAQKLPGQRGVWQVIAGNGGSTLETLWAPTGGTFYGFTEVRVYSTGRVGVVSHQRPVPSPYYATTTAAATAAAEMTIAP